MQGRVDEPDAAIGQLVAHRQRIGRLRRALVSHRTMFLSLARPELDGIGDDEDAERFSELRTRLEEAVQAARDSRDSIVGSFDVLIAHTGYRTNEIMKVLTLASVLLLPGRIARGRAGNELPGRLVRARRALLGRRRADRRGGRLHVGDRARPALDLGKLSP